MKKYIISFLKFAVSLGIGIALIFWFLGQMSESDKQHVLDDVKRANYFWVFLPPLIGLVSNYFRTQRWRLLLRPLGYNPGFWNTFHSVMIMYFMNLFFPRLGEVSRCGILARYEKVPLDKAIGTMVIERIMDVLCLALVMLFLIVAEHDKFAMLYEQIVANSQTTFAETIAKYQISPVLKFTVTGIVVLLIFAFLAFQIFKKGWRHNLALIKARIIGLAQGIISVKDIGKPFLFLYHSLMIWLCYYLMIYLSFRMFPETAALSLLAGGVCLFFGAVANSITPGGLGLYPIFMQIVLALYGVVGSAAISLGLVVWTTQTAGVLGAGLISLTVLAIINRTPALQKEPLKA